MQSYVNEAFLAKRAKYGKWGMYVGFGALFAGLMLTNRNIFVAYLFLVVGLIAATFGSYMSNRYVKEPRADQVIDEAMGSLDKRYVVYHYCLASNHLVLSHYGLTVLAPQAQEGQIIYAKGRWRHKAGMRKMLQFFGEPGLGKPDQELQRDIEWVTKWVAEWSAEDPVPVNGVVVFTNARATLSLDAPPVAAVMAADLAEHMRDGLKGQPTLSTARLKELRRILDEASGQAA